MSDSENRILDDKEVCKMRAALWGGHVSTETPVNLESLFASHEALREVLCDVVQAERGRRHEVSISGRCHLCGSLWPCPVTRVRRAVEREG